MEQFTVHCGKVAGLDRANVDTDQIIPKQFLKRIERSGFGEFLFYDWRYTKQGELNPSFELNNLENQGASILAAGPNFGCGSSREHAPWALQDFGFRVIISASFADIFYNNCLKNGIVPIRMDEEKVKELIEKAKAADYQLTVDLEKQAVEDGQGFSASFVIDPHWKHMLLNGLDEIGLTLQYEDTIAAFESKGA